MSHFLHNKYLSFCEKDFVNDEYFQEQIINPSAEAEKFWNEFLQRFPYKKDTLENAKAFLLSLQFKDELPNDDYIHQHYLNHLNAIRKENSLRIFRISPKAFKHIASAAAIITGIILILSILFYNAPKEKSIAANFGEIKNLLLPDSSIIVLNSNSSIRYNVTLDNIQPREIWLKGEAYFKIKHINKNLSHIKPEERMLVHGDNFLLEVLGTSFDVRQRRNTTEIVLQSGTIQLTFFDSLKTTITLHAGDFVSYNSRNQHITKSTTAADDYVKWQNKNLILTNPTLEEIINYLEDNYGKKIILESPELKNKKIEGPIKLNDFNDALFIISTTLNIEIERKGDLTILRSR